LNVGDTFRKDGQTWMWARCPECLDERAVRKRGPLPTRLCENCVKKVSRKVNDIIWYDIINKGE